MPELSGSSAIPVALSVAGSDNSAGAGAQADLKTFSALGVYGLTAITCVVAEVPGKVSAIAPVTPEVVAEQIRLCFEAYPVAAVKTGMLCSRATLEAVCVALEAAWCARPAGSVRPGLIVDPVMVATSGAPLLDPDGIAAYYSRLFPVATLVTPNLDEVSVILRRKVSTLDQMRLGGRELCDRFRTAFLLKGGHLAGEAVDLLVTPAGETMEFRNPRVPGVSTHGTGCTLSAAIAAGLACGRPLPEAIAQAKAFVTRAIANHYRWTRSAGGETHALNHFGGRSPGS